MEGMVLERKALRPIRAHPFGGHGWVNGEGTSEVAVEFPVQGTKTLSSMCQRVMGMSQSDYVNGPLGTPSTLSRAVGLVDHRGSNEITVADSHLHKHGSRFERAEQPVEIVQELPVLMKVSEFEKLQVRDPQGFTRDLRETQRFTSEIQAGIIHVNSQTAGADVHVPFGGVKGSGWGPHEQGRAAIEFYTETVTVYQDAPLA